MYKCHTKESLQVLSSLKALGQMGISLAFVSESPLAKRTTSCPILTSSSVR
jgi:hypothetical protein